MYNSFLGSKIFYITEAHFHVPVLRYPLSRFLFPRWNSLWHFVFFAGNTQTEVLHCNLPLLFYIDSLYTLKTNVDLSTFAMVSGAFIVTWMQTWLAITNIFFKQYLFRYKITNNITGILPLWVGKWASTPLSSLDLPHLAFLKPTLLFSSLHRKSPWAQILLMASYLFIFWRTVHHLHDTPPIQYPTVHRR